MKEYVLMEATTSTSSTYKKKYKCPYCDERFERAKLPIHIQNKHEDLIPVGWTALRVAFNTINNKTEGHCIICGQVSDWNEQKGRYERLCNNPACHEAYRKLAAERNKNKYGTERLQTDPKYAEEVQRKALAGRKSAGVYKFTDGGEISYLGTYEKKLLEFLDKVMMCKSEDIVAPGPSLKYKYQGVDHIYIPDFYYIPYNLLIEVKDGGSNPNKNPAMKEYKTDQQAAKEKAVKLSKKFNYIRLTDNNFGQLMSIMAVIKFQMNEECYDPVMRINENTMTEDMSGTIAAALPLTPMPIPYETDPDNYYMVAHKKDDDKLSYGITKDPLQYTVYGVDPQEDGFYKAYKTDKGKFNKSYLTFKIKDKQKAKELYEELADLSSRKISFTEHGFKANSNPNFIYSYLTDGANLDTEDQVLFDNRFELVRSFAEQIHEDCETIYNSIMKPSLIEQLSEQVKELEGIINDL